MNEDELYEEMAETEVKIIRLEKVGDYVLHSLNFFGIILLIILLFF